MLHLEVFQVHDVAEDGHEQFDPDLQRAVREIAQPFRLLARMLIQQDLQSPPALPQRWDREDLPELADLGDGEVQSAAAGLHLICSGEM